jgi:hypothetical protein
MPEFTLPAAGGALKLATALREAQVAASATAAYRLIEQGAVRVDGDTEVHVPVVGDRPGGQVHGGVQHRVTEQGLAGEASDQRERREVDAVRRTEGVPPRLTERHQIGDVGLDELGVGAGVDGGDGDDGGIDVGEFADG